MTGWTRTDALQLATVLVGASIAFAFAAQQVISPFDGGILPAGATFVLHGQLPYRDFWLLYGPLGAYVAAIPTAIVGPSVEAVRCLGLTVAAAYAVLAWLLLRRAGVGVTSIPAVIAATAIPILVIGPELNAWNLAQTLAVGAFCVLAYGTRRRGFVLAGGLLGLVILTRLDVGAYALVAAVALRPRVWVIAGTMAVAVPAALVATTLVPIADLVEQLIWFPTLGQRGFRDVPDPAMAYGGPAGLMWLAVVAIPRGAILAGLIACARGAVRDRVGLTLLIFAVLCQAQTLVRGDFYHFAAAAPPAFLLGSVLLARARPVPRTEKALAATMMAIVILAGFVHSGIASGAAPVYDADLKTAAKAIRSVSCAGEPIYVANGRNRYTYNNPVILYFLADRPAGALYTMFNPGVTNTDQAQRRVVNELESNNVRWLVLDESMSFRFEPYNDSQIPGSIVLDTYIDSHFIRYDDIGPFRIMIRDGSSTGC